MTLNSQAKAMLKFQSFGMIGISFLIIAGIFGYFLFKENLSYENRLQTLDREIQQQQKQQIRAEVEKAREFIEHMNSQAEEQLKQQARSAVEQAHSIATSLYNKHRDQLDQAAIKELIKTALRDVRFFKGRGYYFINDAEANAVLMPIRPALEGTSLLLNADVQIFHIINTLLESIDNESGAGFSRYSWYPPGERQKKSRKISYAKKFRPFNWHIGAGDYVQSFEEDLRLAALERLSRITTNNNTSVTILDTKGTVISRTILAQDMQNEPIGPLADDNLQQLLSFANSGGGVFNYQTQTPQTAAKFAFVETIRPFNWVIIADIFPQQISQIIESQRSQIVDNSRSDLKMLVIVLSIAGLVTLALSLLFNRGFSHLFKRYQGSIDLQEREIQNQTIELKLAARVFDSSNDAIVVTDAAHNIIAVNPACLTTSGYDVDEILGQSSDFFASDHQDKVFYQRQHTDLAQQGYWQGEIFHQHKNGGIYPSWVSISTSLDTENKVLNYISTFSDISERKKTEQRLNYLADYDPLTKLAKRHILAERVNEVINYSDLNHQQKFALMLIDLDRFKNINDSLGHNIGDLVLQEIAKRLAGNIRVSDIISRLSGDEFIILVNNNKSESAAKRLATRIMRDLAEPVHISEHDLVVTPSIGIATFPEHGNSFDALLKNADAALHHAKSQGRNNFQFFTFDMHEKASEKLSIEGGLRLALSKQQFEVYYQAQYELGTDKLCGCEALLRWHTPELGMIPPDKFIPIAEESGLILPIGQWVLDQACRQASIWKEQGFEPIPIAVNVSSYQFTNNIVSSIVHSLTKAKLDAKWLVVEITESALMHDPEFTQSALQQLRDLGIKIALDDFGTGYSSLAYLKRFPLDKLKIDRTFITGLPQEQDDLVITRSIIDVARNLNMTTIAEGVETLQQQKLLTELGCQQMQGFLKAKPVAAAQFASEYLALEDGQSQVASIASSGQPKLSG